MRTVLHTGSCLCGGVRYSVHAPLAPIQLCHCRQCRKAQGSAFAANIPVARADFRLDTGAELLGRYESSPGKHRVFCVRCGSPLYSERESQPDTIRLRAGLLDGELDVRPETHAYVASKAGWWTIDDHLPQHLHGVGAGP